MKFIAISDTHGCHRQLELPQGDVLLHAGDVCNKGNRNHVDDFLEWMSELDFKYKILVRGNHDFDLEKGVSLLDREMPSGIIQLDHSGIKIDEVSIWGVPFPSDWENPTWDSIPPETQLLITHQPPYSILDLSPRLVSRGEQGLLEKVKQVQPKVHLFGHIHYSYGQKTIDNTLYINASNYQEKLERIENSPIVFEL